MATTLPLFPSSGSPLVSAAAIQTGLSSVIARTNEGDERLIAAWAIQEGLAAMCIEIHGQRMPSEAKQDAVQRAQAALRNVRDQMAGLSPTRKLTMLASFSKSITEEACGEELWRK